MRFIIPAKGSNQPNVFCCTSLFFMSLKGGGEMKRPVVIGGKILVAALGLSLMSSMAGDSRQAANPGEQFNINKTAAGFLNDAVRPAVRNFGEVPLSFIPNRGQVDERTLFYAVTSRYTLWMTKEGLVFDAAIRERSGDDLAKKVAMAAGDIESVLRAEQSEDKPAEYRRDVSRLIFVGANQNPNIVPLEPAEHRANYFIGRDPAKWHTDIPTSLAVLYKEIYPGIDLKVYGRESQIEYDWVVKPGACVADIRLEYRDVDASALDAEGNLIIKTQFGELAHHRPISYQRLEGRRVDVPSKFVKHGDKTFGFAVEPYEPTHDLVIDPILVYSTYLGGSGDDFATGIAVDKTGAAYVVGHTSSTNFPLKGSFQNKNNGKSDVFVTKFSPLGKTLIYSTFLGGNDSDEAYGIALDNMAAAYITGMTNSYDFPVQDAYQESNRGYPDAFVTKLTPAGNALAYSTYLGGDLYDRGKAIDVDDTGAAYVTGWTGYIYFYWDPIPNDFPLKNAFQSTFGGGRDAFVTKLTPAGNALAYSTYLGTSLTDEGRAIAVDSRGCAYVTGYTNSQEFPLQKPFQAKYRGIADVFVTKFTPEGNALVYSTFLGGSWWDWPYGIAIDGSGAAYVIGETYSWDFPVKNAFQKDNAGLLDAFVSKISPTGQSLSFSTYFGGTNFDEGYAISVDKSGAAYITGETWSTDFPLQAPYQKTNAEVDVFVAKFVPVGNSIICSTLLGGNHRDQGLAIVVDTKGAAYLAGDTFSTDFPLSLAFQKTNKGGWDAFLAKLNLSAPVLIVRAPDGGESLKKGSTQTIRWDYLGSLGATVKIELLQAIKISATIASNASMGKNGQGTFSWKVPANQATGGDFKIRITSTKLKNCSDSSDGYFNISD